MPGFSRMPTDTVRAMAQAGMSTSALVMILLHRFQREDEQGRVYGSIPRSQMAETLGKSERAITKAIERLTEKGLISVKEQGHSGRATVYWLGPSAAQSTTQSQGAPREGDQIMGKHPARTPKDTPDQGHQTANWYPSRVPVATPDEGYPLEIKGGGAKPPLSQRELESLRADNGCAALAPLAADEPEGDEDDFVFKALGLDEGSRREVSYA